MLCLTCSGWVVKTLSSTFTLSTAKGSVSIFGDKSFLKSTGSIAEKFLFWGKSIILWGRSGAFEATELLATHRWWPSFPSFLPTVMATKLITLTTFLGGCCCINSAVVAAPCRPGSDDLRDRGRCCGGSGGRDARVVLLLLHVVRASSALLANSRSRGAGCEGQGCGGGGQWRETEGGAPVLSSPPAASAPNLFSSPVPPDR